MQRQDESRLIRIPRVRTAVEKAWSVSGGWAGIEPFEKALHRSDFCSSEWTPGKRAKGAVTGSGVPRLSKVARIASDSAIIWKGQLGERMQLSRRPRSLADTRGLSEGMPIMAGTVVNDGTGIIVPESDIYLQRCLNSREFRAETDSYTLVLSVFANALRLNSVDIENKAVIGFDEADFTNRGDLR